MHCALTKFHAKGYNGRIVVKSPDTDVLVLLVHYFPQMCNTCELWFQTGSISTTKDGRRYIPVHEICNCLSSVICNVLPAAHAITGFDTTSAFFGIGKKSVYKALKDFPDRFLDLTALSDLDIDQAISVSRNLISHLYEPKRKFTKVHTDLNKLRVTMSTRKDCSLVGLPLVSQHSNNMF